MCRITQRIPSDHAVGFLLSRREEVDAGADFVCELDVLAGGGGGISSGPALTDYGLLTGKRDADDTPIVPLPSVSSSAPDLAR